MARGETLSPKERSLCQVIILPAWAQAQPCPSALRLLHVQGQPEHCRSHCVPAQEPLDTRSSASRFQCWPSLAVLGVVLACSLLWGGPLPSGCKACSPHSCLWAKVRCAQQRSQLGGLFAAHSPRLVLCWMEGMWEEP